MAKKCRISGEALEQFAEDDELIGKERTLIAMYLKDVAAYSQGASHNGALLQRKTDLQKKLFEAEISSGIIYDEAVNALETAETYLSRHTYSTKRVKSLLKKMDKKREKYGTGTLYELSMLSILGMGYEEASDKLKESEEEFSVERRSYDAEWLGRYVKGLAPMKIEIRGIINESFRANLRRVIPLAKKYAGRGADLMDLIQEGNIGLLKGLETFDSDAGYGFSGHAFLHIRRAIIDHLEDKERVVKVPPNQQLISRKIKDYEGKFMALKGEWPTASQIADGLEMNESQVVAAQRATQAEVSVHQTRNSRDEEFLEMYECVSPWIGLQDINNILLEEITRMSWESTPEDLRLSERDLFVLKHRYGILAEKATLDQVAEMMYKNGMVPTILKKHSVHQIERRAFKKLRENPRLQRLMKEIV